MFSHQTQQFPEVLDWLADVLLRESVHHLLTVGVHTGGVEWWLCRRYQEAGQELYVTCVDIIDNPQFAETQNLILRNYPLAKLTFLHRDIRDCTNLPTYDAVFLDGDHSEAGVEHDVQFAFEHSTNIIALSAPTAWDKLKGKYVTESIAAHQDQDKGIGIVYVDRALPPPTPPSSPDLSVIRENRVMLPAHVFKRPPRP